MRNRIILEKLKWDSDFFGLRAGRMTFYQPLFSAVLNEDINEIFKNQADKFDFIDIQVPPAHLNVACALHRNNAYFVSSLATYTCGKEMKIDIEPENCRFGISRDFERCSEITRGSFVHLRDSLNDSCNRFNNDSYFSRETVERYWDAWCKSIFSGELADGIIVYDDPMVKGYLGFACEGNSLKVVLNAVDGSYRGQGIYSKMLSYLLNYLGQNQKFFSEFKGFRTQSQLTAGAIRNVWVKAGATVDIIYNFHWHKG